MDAVDPTTQELVRVRFARREGWVMSVAIVLGLIALSTLLMPIGRWDDLVRVALKLMLFGPLLFGCWHLLRRRGSGRRLTLYALGLQLVAVSLMRLDGEGLAVGWYLLVGIGAVAGRMVVGA